MASKASEWVRLNKEYERLDKEYEFRAGDECVAYVDDDGDCVLPDATTLIPEEALALARWLFDVFTDPNDKAPNS